LGINWRHDRVPAVPLHGELDVLRLDLAPAFDHGLEPILRVALKLLLGQLARGFRKSKFNAPELRSSNSNG
jgi:hypothetical protein